MAQSRWEIARVLDPFGRSTYPHLDRAIGLTVLHCWHVVPCARGDECATRATRTIHTSPILDDETFIDFYHEGAHLEDPEDRDGVKTNDSRGLMNNHFGGELFAWQWAMKAAGFRWSMAMQAEMERCLWSYRADPMATAWGYPHWLADFTPASRVEMDTLIARGLDQARHIVRICI